MQPQRAQPPPQSEVHQDTSPAAGGWTAMAKSSIFQLQPLDTTIWEQESQ